MTVLITLTTAGSDTGPFNLYSNIDGFFTAFATSVSKLALVAGYTSTVVPNFTSIVQVRSTGVCTNFININVTGAPTTTSTTTSTSSTTTTSTTICLNNQPISLRYHLSSGALSCSQSPSTYYTFDNTNYTTTDKLFTNNNCTGVAPVGYYSNGSIFRYWNGTNLGTPSGC
jgi:hypothetical protein